MTSQSEALWNKEAGKFIWSGVNYLDRADVAEGDRDVQRYLERHRVVRSGEPFGDQEV